MSDSTFIDLHEQMQSKGWISDWEFNESIDLYKYNNCTSITACQGVNGDYASDINDNGAWIYHLSKLTGGQNMFYKTTLASFSGDLSNLTDGTNMFYQSTIASFSGDLSKLNIGQNMFRNTNLESFSGDLSRMTDGRWMFLDTPLESFNGDLSNLNNGRGMFYNTAITSFNGDLSNLTNSYGMFYRTPLESFNGDLSSLIHSYLMFFRTALTSFNGDLSKLTIGQNMFNNTALESFNGDLSSLTDGRHMFKNNQPRHYGVVHYKMVGGTRKLVTETFVSNGLKSFNSDLSSLTNGYHMFGSGGNVTYTYTDDNGNKITETTKDVTPLDEDSIMLIADTIKDITSLGLTGEDGQIWLGHDTSITDTTNINKYCDKIAAKGWKVYLNAAQQVANNGIIETISLTNEDGSPIPHYYKPVQVTDENVAEYVDGNGKFYIIVGGQYVFGDDISTYGIFTSYEHAVNEITLGLGLTPCEKPDEKPSEE